MSVITLSGCVMLHPKRLTVASSAVVGPRTMPHGAVARASTFFEAARKVLVRTSYGNHRSHTASAQYCNGLACAMNAGSRVPASASKFSNVIAGFLLHAPGAAALATLLRTVERAWSAIPNTSQP